MKKQDITCPNCRAVFRRIELPGGDGIFREYRCPYCDTLLEILDGSKEVSYRTVTPPAQIGSG